MTFQRIYRKLVVWSILFIASLLILASGTTVSAQDEEPGDAEEVVPPALLTDPFLQLPTEDGIHVVWFTEWEGDTHTVTYGEDLSMTVEAKTIKLSRTAEDAKSRVGAQIEDEQVYKVVTPRGIWRHEALVSGLTAGERVPYFVTSITAEGEEVGSDEFTLQPLPTEGQPLKILLTSDHQLKPMTPANLQMVEKTVGQVDAVFFAGDLINIPDRASEWFDDNRGFAFFPGLQGNGGYVLEKSAERNGITFNTTVTYVGGELIQHAPLFPVVGNHEVMGRYNPGDDLNTQYNNPHPKAVAEERYEMFADLINPDGDESVIGGWVLDNSFNTVTYEELFTLPNDGPAGEQYYAIQFGDVYMIGLFASRIWRTPWIGINDRGKYSEPLNGVDTPDNWGHGEFIFEDLSEGSEQYEWLVEQLNSEAFQNAKYKVVLMHQSPHGVGDNYNPVFAHPVRIIERNDAGRITEVRYEYPIDQDILLNDVRPLLEEAGVQLVHAGHSHLWARLNKDGVNYLETSNVGNNYGCYANGVGERWNVPRDDRYDAANYVKNGDPHGLKPIPPSVYAPMQDDEGNDMPCLASNDMTAFTIFDTESGVLSSYVFDTTNPESEPQLFDEFSLIE